MPANGQSGGLLLLWNGSLYAISVIDHGPHFIHCCFNNNVNGDEWFMTFLYMFPQKEKQPALWDHLLSLQPPNGKPWMIMGDFNCMLNLNDKVGGIRASNRYLINFQSS